MEIGIHMAVYAESVVDMVAFKNMAFDDAGNASSALWGRGVVSGLMEVLYEDEQSIELRFETRTGFPRAAFQRASEIRGIRSQIMMMDTSATYAYTVETENGAVHYNETEATDELYRIVLGRDPYSILGDRLDEAA